jgi:endonuclease YncB( thermonuclease family)
MADDLRKQLEDAGECKLFSLDGIETLARVVKTYDGDSIHVIFPFNGVIQKFICRVAGVDTPEMRDKDPGVKKLAVKAKEFVQGAILGKIVHIKCGPHDKYGRILVKVVYDDDKDLAEELIREGLAKPYSGGTKEIWTC